MDCRPRLLVLELARLDRRALACLAEVAGTVEGRGGLILVRLGPESPEEILAACVAAGLRITGSRVECVDARSAGGLALTP